MRHPLNYSTLNNCLLSKEGKVLADDRQVGDYGGVELHCMVKPNATLLADGYPRTLPSLDGGVSGAVKPPAAVIPATVAMPSSVNNSSAKQSNGKHAPQLSPAFWAKVEDLLRQEQPMDPQLVVAISKSFRLAFEQTILSEQAKQQHNIIG
jgi:hypothetical protein